RFVVPLIVLALPIADALTVVLGRLSHRKALLTRRPDHLAHRLRALGWSMGQIVTTFGLLQVALSALALFVGRGVLDRVIVAAVAAALVGVPTFVAMHGRVYEERRRGIRSAA